MDDMVAEEEVVEIMAAEITGAGIKVAALVVMEAVAEDMEAALEDTEAAVEAMEVIRKG